MRPFDYIKQGYYATLREDWESAYKEFNKYHDLTRNYESLDDLTETSILTKFQPLFLFNYSLTCYHLKRYDDAEKLALSAIALVDYNFQYDHFVYGYDLVLLLEKLIDKIRDINYFT